MTDRPDRLLSKDFILPFMQAISEEIGNFSLRLVLRQAGHEDFADDWPDLENPIMRSAEFAALQRCLRDYYGRGARGLLQRVGLETWNAILQDVSPGRKAFGLMKLLPRSYRLRQALELLAERLRGEDGKVSVRLEGNDFYLVDYTSDGTFGQSTPAPICWSTLGLIQGAMAWANCPVKDVEEIGCRATGADACTFKITLS